MGLIKTKGIVIGVANSSDNDKVLTVLTPDLGKITVFSKGAKKTKNTLLNCTEYLAFSDMIIFKSPNDTYSLNSAEIIELFYNVRIDVEKLLYVSTITKIIYDVTQENQSSEQVLQLLLNTIYILSETDKNLDLILLTFELRLLALIGFLPKISKCVSCDEKVTIDMDKFYFSIRDDGIKCSACARSDKGAIELSKTSFSALIYILSCDAKKLFSFEVPNESIEELRILAQIYLSEKLEKEYKVQKF